MNWNSKLVENRFPQVKRVHDGVRAPPCVENFLKILLNICMHQKHRGMRGNVNRRGNSDHSFLRNDNVYQTANIIAVPY